MEVPRNPLSSSPSVQMSVPPVGECSKNGRQLSTSKRAAQNRAAQRAFRQRKECYIKDLEAKVLELKATKETVESLRQENLQLRDYILALQSRLIEHPSGVPPPPAVYASSTRPGDFLREHPSAAVLLDKDTKS